MPCFMVGYSHAKMLADSLCVPLIEVSHQQGHVAASLWSAGHLELMDEAHLAWHLSGGTTELLLVEPDGKNVTCTKIGGTTDISAGQLIDRTGQLLELPFPSGRHIDALSREAAMKETFKVKCSNMEFSLSGVQNKVQQFHAAHGIPAETAAYALRCVARTADRVFRRCGLQLHAPAGHRPPESHFLRTPVFHRQCHGRCGAGITLSGVILWPSRF